jgi:hypothetical protein
MKRKEFEEMCKEKPEALLLALHKANKEYGSKSEQYFEAFQSLWENRIPHLKEHEIENIMETAKPHTQIAKGLETMAWLYDRLLYRKAGVKGF